MLANLPHEAAHADALADAGVGLVLNMCEDSEYRPGQRDDMSRAYESYGIEETRALRLADLGDHPLDLFDTAVRLVEDARLSGRNVVVHCRGGRERSAAIVAAALVAKEGLTVEQAIERMRSIAPQAAPLPGQRSALELWTSRRRERVAAMSLSELDAAFARAVATSAYTLAARAWMEQRHLGEIGDLTPLFRQALRSELGDGVLSFSKKFVFDDFGGNPNKKLGGVDVVVENETLGPAGRSLAELKWCQKDFETFAWVVFDAFKMALGASSPGARAGYVVVGAPTAVWRATTVCGSLLTDGNYSSVELITGYDGNNHLFADDVAWPTKVPPTIETVVIADAPVLTPHGLWKLRAVRVSPGDGAWIACSGGRPLAQLADEPAA
jgi:hypothetical protein